ncbi:hypothetical protein [Gramella sp. MAR_2010_147]|uniref:hypothetical protein n=1 Tax=Gramella sp. MAR_2010_147 TaxID=1250205 RepID=UPI00087B8678|nr:hypothetical protein [Gramella sp. MAR_2010_147]SDR71019.1 hypothetical protein SAMN04488553_0387 [Gramella sp. MAR_2010_147]
MQKLLKKLPVFIFLILHFTFLIAAIIEKRDNYTALLFLVLIALLLGLFYSQKFRIERSQLNKIDLVLVIFTAIGAIITYWLNIQLDLGVVLSAGITGLISSFLPFINRRSNLLRELPVAMYCGAFAGMTAPFVADGYAFIILAGIFTGIILVLSKETLHGFGGKLGSIAFGGVSIVTLIFLLLP